MRDDLAAILAQPIAHRGLHDRGRGIIENSFAAAEAAVAGGFGIECDIQVSGDGEAVVFHDETLDRLTAETGPVAKRSAAALSAFGLRGGSDTIPTLSAFLAHIGGRTPLVIEIKSRHDGDMRLAARAVAVIATYRGPVALKSFDPTVVAHCRRLGAPYPIGLVGPSERGLTPPLGAACDFFSWHVAELAVLRQTQGDRPAMSWTVRSQGDHAVAKHHAAQIVFEHYDPQGAQALGHEVRSIKPP